MEASAHAAKRKDGYGKSIGAGAVNKHCSDLHLLCECEGAAGGKAGESNRTNTTTDDRVLVLLVMGLTAPRHGPDFSASVRLRGCWPGGRRENKCDASSAAPELELWLEQP